ncbi:high mobility group [Chlorella sorokiniana]|uniref:High mobility group n=1 Tax=Chlorella sorokiniana TaxID=3076 RepID=A0A2P6TW78_CHLSO|nr:high mobility group [Chlorella sorokiniana]|eukprot:PRW58313.1 high mobility group [Chlorella sorokiniana]
MGRGPTAYMLFTAENREAAKAELLAGGADGKAAGVAAVAKLVGQKWAALSDEEKQQYKERAQQLQAEAAEAAAAQSPGGEAGEGGEAPAPRAAAPPPPFGFPTSLVKRIVLADDEISRVSADALRAICKAAELFVGQLAVRALEHAQANKKKNFKAADIEHLAGRDRRLVDMGLKEVLEDAAAAAAGGGGSPAENKEGDGAAGGGDKKKSAKRQKQEEAAAGTRQITSFFTAAAAAAPADSS